MFKFSIPMVNMWIYSIFACNLEQIYINDQGK